MNYETEFEAYEDKVRTLIEDHLKKVKEDFEAFGKLPEIEKVFSKVIKLLK